MSRRSTANPHAELAQTWDVFISYASQDRHVAEAIEADLGEAGFSVWRDASAVRPGDRLRARIEQGLRGSAVILVVVSQRSMRSQWVLNELDAGMLREIRERRVVVVPALIGRVDVDAMPVDLHGKLYLDLRHDFPRRFAENRDRLHAAIAAAVREQRGEPEVELVVGDELMGRFIGHRFRGSAQPDPEYLDAASDFVQAIEDWARQEGEDTLFDALQVVAARYGRLGLRQLCLFWMDVGDFDLRGFTAQEFADLAWGIECTAMLFVLQDTFQDERKQLVVRLNGTDEPVFRLVDVHGP